MPYKDPAEGKRYRAKRYKAKRSAIRAQQQAHYNTHQGRAVHLVGAAKRRAAHAGVPFDLVPADVVSILTRGKCELTGLPFKRVKGARSPYSPSIDRIDPAVGYVRGNVRVVAYALNAAFGFWGEEVLWRIVAARWPNRVKETYALQAEQAGSRSPS